MNLIWLLIILLIVFAIFGGIALSPLLWGLLIIAVILIFFGGGVR